MRLALGLFLLLLGFIIAFKAIFPEDVDVLIAGLGGGLMGLGGSFIQSWLSDNLRRR